MSFDLPPSLRLAADRLMEGLSRRDLAARAGAISQRYRGGGGSSGVIAGREDAAAYVLTRLPATYAACARVLAEAAERAPDFTPVSLLDAGAGPGGGGWAATETWPQIETASLLDSNRAFLDIAEVLARDGPPALAGAERLRIDLTAAGDWPRADLVLASYALAEIPQTALAGTVDRLWAAALGLLVVVEPGTPAGHRRLLAVRDRLIGAGATILAPCPHALACPLVEPDWCHFAQRLARSRDHRLAKGAQAPFEDEKFSYLVFARPEVHATAAAARVLAPPRQGKAGVELKLCAPDGRLEHRFVARRDKAAYSLARRLDWGDAAPDTTRTIV